MHLAVPPMSGRFAGPVCRFITMNVLSQGLAIKNSIEPSSLYV